VHKVLATLFSYHTQWAATEHRPQSGHSAELTLRRSAKERPRLVILTFRPHALLQALLQATVLTSVPIVFVDGTVLCAPACVAELLTDATLEETFTAFTTYYAIMTT